MSKLSLGFALALFANLSLAATTIECTATDVYGGPLEESFSVEEYPDVSLSASKVWLGSSLYSMADGAKITIKRTAKKTTVTVITKSESEEFDIIIDNKTKKGTITYKSRDSLYDMADITCKL